MAILNVICKDCGEEMLLRGWVEKEDLKGTEYENLIESITENELYELEKQGKIKDPWEMWNGKCPSCYSTNVICF